MGQRISSSRLTSLVSPNQHSPSCMHHHHPPHGRRLSLGSLQSNSFRSLSCLRGHIDNSREAHCCSHNSLVVYTKTLQRSKSQDREPTSSNMASEECCNCNALCTNCPSKKQIVLDLQNGNSANTCVKSSSIERYMSALTERMGQTLPYNGECKCYMEPSTSGSCNGCKCTITKGAKSRNKNLRSTHTTKKCNKPIDGSSVFQDCFGCIRDIGTKERIVGKTSFKKRWVSKFYGSKLTKNGGKISVNGGSTDSVLDIAECSYDPNCVCTLYRKMDETCKVTQSSTDVEVSSNVSQISSGRSVCVRVGNSVHNRHEYDNNNPSRSNNSDLPTLNITNLPINITVSRVGQPVYSALLTTSSSNQNMYGTLTHNAGANIYGALVAEGGNSILLSVGTQNTPLIDLRLSAEEYPVEDCEERARVRRAWEIAEGVDPPPGYRPHPHIQVLSTNEIRTFLQRQSQTQSRIHTQVDFIHCLVPDLKAINQCSFYWWKMDRYEAERLLEGKPEGTFLLRDSAQEDYLFSVSFRKYGRSLHARIEQFNHKFSFDSHDPGVYAANTVTGLIEHYKDPACVMFFEPMLTAPLSRTFAFPLQHICRAVIASCTSYDGINELRLPQSMKAYLKEYHYRQRVRVKRFEGPPEGFHWSPEEVL